MSWVLCPAHYHTVAGGFYSFSLHSQHPVSWVHSLTSSSLSFLVCLPRRGVPTFHFSVSRVFRCRTVAQSLVCRIAFQCIASLRFRCCAVPCWSVFIIASHLFVHPSPETCFAAYAKCDYLFSSFYFLFSSYCSLYSTYKSVEWMKMNMKNVSIQDASLCITYLSFLSSINFLNLLHSISYSFFFL